jgi:hypothetical protein
MAKGPGAVRAWFAAELTNPSPASEETPGVAVDGQKSNSFIITKRIWTPQTSGQVEPILVQSHLCCPPALLGALHGNWAAKVPEDVWPEFKVRAQAAYQAPSRSIARELAAGVVAEYGPKYDSAVACFMDDFEACIAHLRFPVTHRRAIRTTIYLNASL